MNDDVKPLSEMPILRKRFDDNPRKRFRNSGMIEAKRARFKDMKTGIDHPEKRSDFSAPVEAREEPFKPVSDSSDPKTSEFAYFKRLKQGVGHTARINSVNRESIQMKNSGPSKNGREFGEAKFINDVEAPIFDKKLSTLDVGSSLHPEDVAIHSSDVHSRVDDYTERLKPAPAIKTPTAIDLDNFVSTSGTASVNSGSQLKDGDIFLSKRLKLQQVISKTLFLEANNLSEECDVVSLLLSRLLPEGSSKIPSKRKAHMEPQLKDKCQEHLRDSSFEFGECWDGMQKLIQTDVDNFLDGGVSSAYRDTHTSCQINEANIFARTSVETMLLGFKERSGHGSSSNEHWSGTFVDRNLLTSSDKTSSNIFKNEVDGQWYDSFVSDESRKFSGRTHSYELPTICYDRFVEDCPKRNRLVFPDSWQHESSERFESTALCNFRDTANLDEFPDDYQRSYCLEYREDRFGSCALVNLRDSAELNEPEIKGEHSPLLLTWGTDGTNMRPFRDLNDMDHELYSPPSWNEDHQFGLNNSTSPDIYQSPSSSMLHSSSDILRDHTGPRSSWAPITLLCSPDQLNPYDDRLSKDVFTGSSMLHSSSDILPDHTGPRSSWAPITLLCGPDQLNPYDDRLSKDVFTGSSMLHSSSDILPDHTGPRSSWAPITLLCGPESPDQLNPYDDRLSEDVFTGSSMLHSSSDILRDHTGPTSSWAPITLLCGPDQLNPYDDRLSKDVFTGSSMLHSSSDILRDHTGPRSSWAPISLLCGPDQLNPYDDRLSKDVFTGSCVYVISEAHDLYMGSVVNESVVPHVGALLISQGLDSNLGLKSELLPDCTQEQDMKGLMMPQLVEHSLINVASPGRREVSFPSQLHRISWLDTAVETSYEELQISTLDNLS